MSFLTRLSTAVMEKLCKWNPLGFASSGKYWRHVSSPREPPAGTEIGVPADFPWETHGLEVPHLLKLNDFLNSLFTCT